jgi:antirestriction protein ArdC
VESLARTAAKFRTYSLNNQLLIALQRPEATRVAGYRAWQGLGRQVRKGERGIAIFAPIIVKHETDNGGDEERRLVNFRVVHVFDQAQTDGDPLEDLGTACLDAHGADEAERAEDLWGQLVDAASRRSIPVQVTSETMHGARGWYRSTERDIHIVTDNATAMVRTLLHELAHALDPACEPGSETCRGDREVLAQSVAYIVGEGLGIAMDQVSAIYLANWQANGGRTTTDLADSILSVPRELESAISTTREPVGA